MCKGHKLIGILAYGSLISDPGWEIRDQIDHWIPNVKTPFPVEYARRSKSRANAPTLVPVPTGKGDSVQAKIIVMKRDVLLNQVVDMLYRREIHRVGDTEKVYKEPDGDSTNKIRIARIHHLCNRDTVIYTDVAVNIEEILDENLTDLQKANILADAACDSLIEKTYNTCEDGIHYLDAAIQMGVITRLTEPYKQAILRKAGITQDSLALAREAIANSKGL